MDKDELFEKLAEAQNLLNEVYGVACNNPKLKELERLMSVADTCIIEALETDWSIEND